MQREGKDSKMVRGVRNRNPLNIKRSTNNWLGLVKNSEKIDPVFCVFKDAKYGIRAACKLFLNYKRFYGIDTIQGIISRFAPPMENNSERYSEFVCKRMNKRRDEHLDLYDANVMLELLKAMILFENGIAYYSDSEIREGMSLAGVT